MLKAIAMSWNYIFEHRVSPLRHIPDMTTRPTLFKLGAGRRFDGEHE
jgi:hypothetical protein